MKTKLLVQLLTLIFIVISFTILTQEVSASCDPNNCTAYNWSWSDVAFEPVPWMSRSISTQIAAGENYKIMIPLNVLNTYNFNTCNSYTNFDTYLCMYDATCTLVAWNDDYCDAKSSLTYTPSSNTYYYPQFAGYSTYYGQFQVDYRITACPVLSPLDATWNTISSSISENGAVYLQLPAIASGSQYRLQLSMIQGGGTASYDTYLHLFTANGTQLAFNDDTPSSTASEIDYSGVSDSLNNGYVRVGGYSTNYGSFTLAYRVTPVSNIDLSPYDPGWGAPITFSNNPDNRSAPLVAGMPSYIAIAMRNNGTTDAGAYHVRVMVDGNQAFSTSETWLPAGYYVYYANNAYTFASAGQHTVRLEVDYQNEVVESNEANNVYETTVTANSPMPDLKPYTIGETSIPIHFTVNPDSWACAAQEPVPINCPLYIPYGVQNAGNAPTGPFSLRILIDGNVVHSDAYSGYPAGDACWCCPNNQITLTTLGTHIVRMELDYSNSVAEMREDNNVYIDTIQVVPQRYNIEQVGQIGWVDPLGESPAQFAVSHNRGTHVSNQIVVGDTAYFDDGLQNVGNMPFTTTIPFEVRLNGNLVYTSSIAPILYPNQIAMIEDIPLVATSSGSNQIIVRLLPTSVYNGATYVFWYNVTASYTRPDLSLYTPLNWSGSIVASGTQGIHTTGTSPIVVGQQAYLYYAFSNIGDASITTPFHCVLKIDGTAQSDITISPPFAMNQNQTVEIPYTFPTSGPHTIQVALDNTDAIWEYSNTNNVSSLPVTVQALPFIELVPFDIGWGAPLTVSNADGVTDNTIVSQSCSAYINIAFADTGNQDAGPFDVRVLVDGSPISIFHETSLVAGHYNTHRSIAYAFNTTGSHIVRMEVDYLNAVSEGNEQNNFFQYAVNVTGPLPDLAPNWWNYGSNPPLAVTYLTTDAFQTSVPVNRANYWTAYIKNFGSAAAPDIPCRVLVDGVTALNQTCNALNVGANGWVQGHDLIVSTLGYHTLTLIIDPDNTIPEACESNNTYVDQFLVVPQGVDLQSGWLDGWSGPIVVKHTRTTDHINQPIVPAETSFVDVWGYNQGNIPLSGSFSNRLLLDGNTVYTHSESYSGTDSLFPGALNPIIYSNIPVVIPTSGTHILRLELDYLHTISESVETNNYQEHEIVLPAQINRPDLTPFTPLHWSAPIVLSTRADSVVETNTYVVNQTYYLKWSFMNIGDTATTDTLFYTLRKDDAYSFITWYRPSSIAMNESYTYTGGYSFTFTSPGVHTIEMFLDTPNRIWETNEANNHVSVSFNVVNNLPDLTPATPSGNPNWRTPVWVRSTQEGVPICAGVPAYISFAYTNAGVHSTTDTLFYQVNIDGTVWSNWYSTTPFAPGEVRATPNYPRTFTTTGQHTIRLLLDPTNRIDELNESNNIYDTTIYVQSSQPDLISTIPNGWTSCFRINPHITYPSYSYGVEFDFAFKNAGSCDITTDSVEVRSEIDGVYAGSFYRRAPIARGDEVIASFDHALTTPGTHTIRITLDPSNHYPEFEETNNVYETSFTYTPPPITITSPNGGENWMEGEVHHITWSANPLIHHFRVLFRTSGTGAWVHLTDNLTDAYSYPWTIPDSASSTCSILVDNADDISQYDMTDSPFTVFPLLHVTTPNGGEFYQSGRLQVIAWMPDIPAVPSYSIDNGTNWIEIGSGLQSSPILWTLPTVNSSQCRIKVVINSGQYDLSDTTFTISPDPIHLISPNGGESWLVGSTQTIRWEADPNVHSFRVLWRPNSSAGWVHLSDGIAANSLDWTIPNNTTAQGMVLIDNADDISSYDMNDNPFTIYQPLTGTKTIGGTSPDYATFADASTALTVNGVGTGGVIFNVRPGIYSEMVTINPITNSSASNPVVFQKDPSYSGIVQISPAVTTTGQSGIKLCGCQYVTFDGISVIDTSTGTNGIANGVTTTNSSGTQGAQHNWIKNATIRLRISSGPNGVYQGYTTTTPTSPSGAQSDNHYINLKISKVSNGFLNLSITTYPDVGLEIGSDSVGVNYSNRFTIGALGVSDTIGGVNNVFGISTSNTTGLNIHDIDIANLLSYSSPSTSVVGLNLWNFSGVPTPNVVKNNRIYNLTSHAPAFGGVNGIRIYNPDSHLFKLYNNLIYGLYWNAPTAVTTSVYSVTGIHSYSGNIDIDHNTILLDDNGITNCQNYCSAVLYDDFGVDSIRNNIFANYIGNGDGSTYHVGIYRNSGAPAAWWSNNNCIYIPNSTIKGYVGNSNGLYFNSLANWQATADSPDANSVYGDPQFVSTTAPIDPHIRLNQPNSIIEHAGIPIASITTDLDGETRLSPPDIGADEGQFSQPLVVTSPNGSENWVVGYTHPITWTPTAARVNSIWLSTNNGSSWSAIAPNSIQGYTQPFAWIVPNLPSSQCRIRINTNDGRTDSSDVVFAILSASAVVSTSPQPIDFGDCHVGSGKLGNLYIRNSGTDTLRIISFDLPYTVVATWLNRNIAPGDSVLNLITWTAQALGTWHDTLYVRSNASNGTRYAVPLTGFGRGAVVSTPDTLVSFGTVHTDSTKSVTVHLVNSGNDSLYYSLVYGPPNVTFVPTSFAIGAGNTGTFALRWTPPWNYPINDSVVLTTTAINQSRIVLRLTGTARGQMCILAVSGITFDTVATGGSQIRSMYIRNPGNDTLHITNASIAISPATIIPSWTTRTILPGDSAQLSLTWHPVVSGNLSDTLIVVSDAFNLKRWALTITGVAAGNPAIAVRNTTITFGSVAVGSSGSQTIYVRSTGSIPLVVSNVTVPTNVTKSWTTQTIIPGDSVALLLTWTPPSIGTLSGNLIITSNATANPTLSISITGNAYQTPGIAGGLSISCNLTTHDVTLTWTTASGSITGYNIYRYATSGYFAPPGVGTLIGSVLTPTLTYTDTSVGTGVKYFYRVTTYYTPPGSSDSK